MDSELTDNYKNQMRKLGLDENTIESTVKLAKGTAFCTSQTVEIVLGDIIRAMVNQGKKRT